VAGKGGSSTTPIVHALIAPDSAPLPSPQRRDTGMLQFAIREMLNEERAGVRFSMQQVWGDEARP
jgi:hypothetical protein